MSGLLAEQRAASLSNLRRRLSAIKVDKRKRLVASQYYNTNGV